MLPNSRFLDLDFRIVGVAAEIHVERVEVAIARFISSRGNGTFSVEIGDIVAVESVEQSGVCKFASKYRGGRFPLCAKCGVETAKPIWVREHSCPACGFETDGTRMRR